ncbi:hypothetical protein N431DRAFT_488506 [Stipitochalara longipes BDJ]|nr:hypothetical protein N431DRAFT_488506 [Stipitochalara longipes BDJ]
MPLPLRCTSLLPSRCAKNLCRARQSTRFFSTTPRQDQRITRNRRQLFRWLGSQGQNFLNPLNGSTNYLGAYNAEGQLRRVVEAAAEAERKKKKEEGTANEPAKEGSSEESEEGGGFKGQIPPETTRDLTPFPLNRSFVSQPVVSNELREEIWKRVMQDGKSVREVSAELAVEMSRVGAVVRLKEIEKYWEQNGRPLAKTYHEAVMSMLPKTPYDPENNHKTKPHESINDLPVHRKTGTQIFHPTSESRHFTREDAAKIFDERLLPADLRVPHPELAEMHKDYKAGLSLEEREARQKERDEIAERKRQRATAKKAKQEAAVKKVDTGRVEFRFTEISVDDAGKDGRGFKGVGWRYGHPHMDRSRGTVKIPTTVG